MTDAYHWETRPRGVWTGDEVLLYWMAELEEDSLSLVLSRLDAQGQPIGQPAEVAVGESPPQALWHKNALYVPWYDSQQGTIQVVIVDADGVRVAEDRSLPWSVGVAEHVQCCGIAPAGDGIALSWTWWQSGVSPDDDVGPYVYIATVDAVGMRVPQDVTGSVLEARFLASLIGDSTLIGTAWTGPITQSATPLS